MIFDSQRVIRAKLEVRLWKKQKGLREGVYFADKARELRRSGAEWPARSVFELQTPLYEQARGVVELLRSDDRTANDLHGAVWKRLPILREDRREFLENVFLRIDTDQRALRKQEIVRELENAYDLVR